MSSSQPRLTTSKSARTASDIGSSDEDIINLANVTQKDSKISSECVRITCENIFCTQEYRHDGIYCHVLPSRVLQIRRPSAYAGSTHTGRVSFFYCLVCRFTAHAYP